MEGGPEIDALGNVEGEKALEEKDLRADRFLPAEMMACLEGTRACAD